MIEDYPITNPNYHNAGDTLESLNLDLCTGAVQAMAAALAAMADR